MSLLARIYLEVAVSVRTVSNEDLVDRWQACINEAAQHKQNALIVGWSGGAAATAAALAMMMLAEAAAYERELERRVGAMRTSQLLYGTSPSTGLTP